MNVLSSSSSSALSVLIICLANLNENNILHYFSTTHYLHTFNQSLIGDQKILASFQVFFWSATQ